MRRYRSVVGVLLLLLPSTGLLANRYLNWGKQTFLQVEQVKLPVEKAQEYIRSKMVYDMFKTVIHVDALWYTKDVVAIYNTIAQSQARTTKEYDSRECVFYVLISPSDEKHELSCSDNNAWSIYIKAHGNVYAPKENGIEKIDLDTIDRSIFGKKYTRFKAVYKVIFDASCLDAVGQDWELVFAKNTFIVPLSWYKNEVCSN